MRTEGQGDYRLMADEKDLVEFSCSNLSPITTYQFYVETYSVPVCMPGEGPRSTTVSCKTGEAAPEAPPQNLVVLGATLDEVTVQWEAPGSSNGVVQGYRLFFDVEGQDDYVEVLHHGTVQPWCTLVTPLYAACGWCAQVMCAHRMPGVAAPRLCLGLCVFAC